MSKRLAHDRRLEKETTELRYFVVLNGLDPDKMSAADLIRMAQAYGRCKFVWYTAEKFYEIITRGSK